MKTRKAQYTERELRILNVQASKNAGEWLRIKRQKLV